MIEWIKTFGINIWQGFVENKDTITAFFMSGQAVSFVAALVMLFKNLRGTKDNTASSLKLNATLDNTNQMSESVKTLDANFLLLKNENDSLRTELKETENKIQQSNKELANKLNAIIEVQAIVYSTIRDDGVRQTVNTILNNARYSEKNFKESLESQIDELKQSYSRELENVNARMNIAVENIKSELNADKNAENEMKKRVSDEPVRY